MTRQQATKWTDRIVMVFFPVMVLFFVLWLAGAWWAYYAMGGLWGLWMLICLAFAFAVQVTK